MGVQGIVGVIQPDVGMPAPEVVRRMRDASVHQIGEEQWADGRAALAGGHGVYVDDEIAVVLAGSAWLSGDDSAPVSVDPAFIARAWRRWGIDLAEHLEGPVAVAVWERRTSVLHLVRGRTGAQPLFWARSPGAIAFASDLNALLTVPWVSRELARDHLAEFLAFRAVHAPRTLLRHVEQVDAGHRLRWAGDAARAVRYHHPRYAAPGTPVPHAGDVLPDLHAAIDRAVRRWLATDDQVGVYLSGGVGSTTVVAAARAASRTLRTFTVAFAEDPYPESPFAGRIARLMGMDHQTVTVGSREIAEGFDATVTAMGHPNGNPSSILQLALAHAASASVGLVLTGDGADQLFGGRMLDEPAAALARTERFHRLPHVLRRVLAVPMKHSERLRPLLLSPEEMALENGFGGVALFDDRQRRSLLLDEVLVRPGVRREILSGFYHEVDSDLLNQIMHAFLRTQLVGDILPRVGQTTAAAGLGVAFPLLDREVQRLAKLLPGAFKMRGLGGSTTTRWLLRALLQGSLPPALINRPDRDMPRPMDAWLEGPGRIFLEERFARLREDPLGLWHHTGLEALRRALGRQPGAAHRLWALFLLDAWIRQVGAT